MVQALHADLKHQGASDRIIDKFQEAKAVGIHARPEIIDPVTDQLHADSRDEDVINTLEQLDNIEPEYS
ncbi:MAG: hypothetical protein AB3N28_11820, partial [Kordiimonas sp.]